jgi:hypothetical protein
MNVKEIAQEYLRKNGYDGLCCDDSMCGCDIDDICPCGEFIGECKPAYKVPYDPKVHEECEAEEDDYIYTEEKPVSKDEPMEDGTLK